ncbi:MAG: type II toxin-antitoxin system PemK/MazF family toxin [Deltaproteobacteria bacterium]|nr:type II toxin-antitoxin system PemK/MazF family toxin [Deltaproteobacteria bacterium]
MARRVERGDLWLCRFAPPDKRRPVLVLSRQAALDHLRTAVVAPISTTAHGVPSEVPVGPEQGLKAESVVNLDHLLTVPQTELRHWLGRLDERRMAAVCEALAIAMGCR